MASITSILILLLSFVFTLPTSQSHLSTNYYSKSCPRFYEIMEETTTNKQITSPTTAGAALRLFFHDCFVTGCDASALISSTPFNKAERDADINLSLPGDGFDVVVRAKAALELSCPGIVSCADILAVATRNLVSFVGGPFYTVLLGRKDGLTSKASLILSNTLPKPNMTIDEMLSIFERHNFSAKEMVALSGAHSIGFSHCSEFASEIYNYSSTQKFDPSYNPRLAQGLCDACANYKKDPSLSVFNDIMTPNKFDNVYFQNLPKGLGILASDRGLYNDARTRTFVELYARDQDAFFSDFAKAMQKLSLVGIKTGKHGEIRRRCDAFNNIQT
ncbi:peroxidase 31-like [Amaranthus tricolor]|uniref:peroxidase 31-like n=1 Tax=Amaranthus tricolor TaxID=29722 RepID=UPI002582A50E|nr:peroxidase 31-like [Amaranthus tricolor]